MKKISVIGCPGAGKSTFSLALQKRIHIPLFHLDNLWHKPDKTTVSQEEFQTALENIVGQDAWIIDGNYLSTMEYRLRHCDTVFFLDYPLEVCLAGVESRIGKHRVDMPWVETEFDPEFREWIEAFPDEQLPQMRRLLKRFEDTVRVISFHTREQAEAYLKSIDSPL